MYYINIFISFGQQIIFYCLNNIDRVSITTSLKMNSRYKNAIKKELITQFLKHSYNDTISDFLNRIVKTLLFFWIIQS